MHNVGIFLFPQIELLDFAGPYEVFSVTDELNNHQLFNVFTIADGGQEIKTINGLKVLADYDFHNHPPVDILVLPGGIGTRNEVENSAVLTWINKLGQNSRILMSVCSGARFLAKLGLLDHKESTTHHSVFASVQELAPLTRLTADKRFVDNENVMTAGGISAGIDLALHVVEKLHGRAIVAKTIKYMEYGDWKKE